MPMHHDDHQIDLASYAALIESFLNMHLPLPTFRKEYMTHFLSESTPMTNDAYDILNGLFLDLEAYAEDPDLREDDEATFDEAALRDRAGQALNALRPLFG